LVEIANREPREMDRLAVALTVVELDPHHGVRAQCGRADAELLKGGVLAPARFVRVDHPDDLGRPFELATLEDQYAARPFRIDPRGRRAAASAVEVCLIRDRRRHDDGGRPFEVLSAGGG
jgi:hypothetical protein